MDIDFSNGGLQLRLANSARLAGDHDLTDLILSTRDLSSVIPDIAYHSKLNPILYNFFKDFPGTLLIRATIENLPDQKYKSLFLESLFEDMAVERDKEFPAVLTYSFNSPEVYFALEKCLSLPDDMQEYSFSLLYDTANEVQDVNLTKAVANTILSFAKSLLLERVIDAMSSTIATENSKGDLEQVTMLIDTYKDSLLLDKVLTLLEEIGEPTFSGYEAYSGLSKLLTNKRLEPFRENVILRIRELNNVFGVKNEKNLGSFGSFTNVLKTLFGDFEKTSYDEKTFDNLAWLAIKIGKSMEEPDSSFRILQPIVKFVDEIKAPFLAQSITQNYLRLEPGSDFYDNWDFYESYTRIARSLMEHTNAVSLSTTAANILLKCKKRQTATKAAAAISAYEGHPKQEQVIDHLEKIALEKGEGAIYRKAGNINFMHAVFKG